MYVFTTDQGSCRYYGRGHERNSPTIRLDAHSPPPPPTEYIRCPNQEVLLIQRERFCLPHSEFPFFALWGLAFQIVLETARSLETGSAPRGRRLCPATRDASEWPAPSGSQSP